MKIEVNGVMSSISIPDTIIRNRFPIQSGDTTNFTIRVMDEEEAKRIVEIFHKREIVKITIETIG